MTHTAALEKGFLPDMDEEEQKLFTASELLLYKHAVEYRLRAVHKKKNLSFIQQP